MVKRCHSEPKTIPVFKTSAANTGVYCVQVKDSAVDKDAVTFGFVVEGENVGDFTLFGKNAKKMWEAVLTGSGPVK